MKRRRRIEITRYTRRVTMGGVRSEETAAAEQLESDLILEALAVIPPAPTGHMDGDRLVPDDAPADHPPRRRPFFRLRDLLRLLKRT